MSTKQFHDGSLQVPLMKLTIELIQHVCKVLWVGFSNLVNFSDGLKPLTHLFGLADFVSLTSLSQRLNLLI